jgi:hypothetical protein
MATKAGGSRDNKRKAPQVGKSVADKSMKKSKFDAPKKKKAQPVETPEESSEDGFDEADLESSDSEDGGAELDSPPAKKLKKGDDKGAVKEKKSGEKSTLRPDHQP